MEIYEHVNRALISPEVRSMRRKDYIYASRLGYMKEGRVYASCRRAEFYRMTNVPEEIPETPEGMRRMLYGTYIGMAEVELAKKARVYVADEVAVIDNKHKISGKIDIITFDPAASVNPYIGGEHKSIHGFYSIKGTVVPNSQGNFVPKLNHLAQTAFYAHMYREGIPRWQIWYFCRDTGQSKVHEVALTPDGKISANGVLSGFTMGHIFEWATSVIEHIRLGTEPERDFHILWSKEVAKQRAMEGEITGKGDCEKAMKGHKLVKGDFQCRYCKYPYKCWAGETLPYEMSVQEAWEALH